MTQTNADRKILALGVKSAVFSAKELSKALDFLLKAIKDDMKPMEQKNYVDFQNPGGVSLLNVVTEDTEAKGFAQLARQGGVNVSIKRDQQAGTFYLCLQGRQEDMLAAATEYQMRQHEQRDRQRPRSLTAELEHEKAEAASRAASQAKAPERGARHDRRHP